VEFQKTIAAMTRLSPEARNCCASAPRLVFYKGEQFSIDVSEPFGRVVVYRG
jgi:hypothetical protein